MNNTPRTDAAAWPETDVVEASFGRQLETELAAVTEQVHTLSSEVHTLSSEVHTLGEQRDRLAEALRNAERTCADD